MVLGFTYLVGKTFKAREFTKNSALVNLDEADDKKGVGILCSFFTLTADGTLTGVHGDKHKFRNIETYFGTINAPVYNNGLLKVSEELVEDIDAALR